MDHVKQHKLARFMETTGLNADEATQFLEASNWDVDVAGNTYFADDLAPTGESSATHTVPDDYTGPRTLDGRPAPESSTTPRAPKPKSIEPAKPGRRTGLATFSSLANQDRDDDSDEEDARRKRRNLFAGGEKSGLAVQDPNRPSEEDETNELLRGIWDQASSHGEKLRQEAAARPASRFTGSARTLGGEGTESRAIPNANPPRRSTGPSRRDPADEMEVAQREIHLWTDGFSVGAGPLHPFSNPANQAILRMIHGGQAPLDLLNVRRGQQVNVTVVPHQEDWRQLPKPKEAFSGQGQRLGAPVPGVSSETSSAAAPATPAAPAAPVVSADNGPSTLYDPDQPSVAIRIQMPTGARLTAQFNLTQTVDDIYSYISSSEPTLVAGRSYVIATTFPNKNHTEKEAKLGDLAEFKKGGVAVVKWV